MSGQDALVTTVTIKDMPSAALRGGDHSRVGAIGIRANGQSGSHVKRGGPDFVRVRFTKR